MELLNLLHNDIRFEEGLNTCINCGMCTAVCPAASVCEYDPREIVNTVQQNNESTIETLLKSETIWHCGECLSCKTRCPKGNTPGYIIQALRALSIETGMFMESEQGRKQLAIKRTVGDHILQYGYCVYLDEIDTELFPEQGPVWDWLKSNRESILERLGTSYLQDRVGTLRNIPEESIKDLKRIFEETGASKRFEQLETLSEKKANELKMDRETYFNYLFNPSLQSDR